MFMIPADFSAADIHTEPKDWWLPLAEAYVADADKRLALGEGAVLAGTNGCGKTFTAIWLARMLMDITGRVYAPVFLPSFTFAKQYAPAVGHSIWLDERQESFDAMCEESKILILDDVGHEHRQGGLADMLRAKLSLVLRKRRSLRGVTLITTNLMLDDEERPGTLLHAMGGAVVSVLDQTCPHQCDVGQKQDLRERSRIRY